MLLKIVLKISTNFGKAGCLGAIICTLGLEPAYPGQCGYPDKKEYYTSFLTLMPSCSIRAINSFHVCLLKLLAG